MARRGERAFVAGRVVSVVPVAIFSLFYRGWRLDS